MAKELKNVEIFATGTWKGDAYTTEKLDKIVAHFIELNGKVDPMMKLGHDFSPDVPAVGWVTRIARAGNKLVADVGDIPDKVYEAIKQKMYKKISAEMILNYKDAITGKVYDIALSAIALIGANHPAVTTLKDVVAHEAKVKMVSFDIFIEDDNMYLDFGSNPENHNGIAQHTPPGADDPNTNVTGNKPDDNKGTDTGDKSSSAPAPEDKNLPAGNDPAADDKGGGDANVNSRNKGGKKKMPKPDETKIFTQEEFDALRADSKANREELDRLRNSTIKSFLDDAVNVHGNISPYERGLLEQVMLGADNANVKTFTANRAVKGDDGKVTLESTEVKMTEIQILKTFVSGLGKRIELGEKGSSETDINKPENTDAEELEARVKKYTADNPKANYGQTVKIVSAELEAEKNK